MRFFRAYRERKAEEARKSSPESETRRPEGGIHRYLFRTVSAFFTRNQDDDDSASRSVPHSGASVSDAEATTPVRRQRKGWSPICGSQGSDLDGNREEPVADDSTDNDFSAGVPRNCLSDEEFAIRRSASSVQLPSAVVRLRETGHRARQLGRYPRRGSLDNSASGARLSPSSSDDENQSRPAENDLRAQFLLNKRLSTAEDPEQTMNSRVEHLAAKRLFNIKHGTILDIDGPTVPYDQQQDWSDDGNGNERSSRWRIRDRRFFNLRNSISSLRRSLSTPKSRHNKRNDPDSDPGVLRSVMSSYVSQSDKEYDSSSSLSDSERSPNKMRLAFGLDGGIVSSIISPDSQTSREDSAQKNQNAEPIASRKERVVILTAGDPTDVVTLTPTQWDADAVRKIEETFTSLPLLKDLPISSRADVFQRKLIACQTIVDFGAKKVMQRAIEFKRQTLLEIIEYISTTRNCMNERLLQDVIDMVEANVFRSLPPREKKNIMFYDIEEDEPTLENSWPHLQIVYDVFLRVIVSNEVTSKMAKNVIDKPFVLKLINVLNSEDQRERDYLKMILHRIYGKIMPLRTFIRKAMDNVFTNFIYETENPYGITELLEILGSIINGFAVPLKEEHKVYLEKSLTPLHKPKSVRSYHAALSYCMIQYINKDCSLAGIVLRAILNFWPTTSAQTEVLFINELEEVLSLTEMAELKGIMKAVARRLSQCVSSAHFQVAERALYVWNNNRVVRQLNVNKEIVYPYVVPAVKANIENHWNEAVRALTYNVSKLMSDHDQELYNRCVWPCASSRRFLPVTLTPHNSWDGVVPMGCDITEPLDRATQSSDTSDYNQSL